MFYLRTIVFMFFLTIIMAQQTEDEKYLRSTKYINCDHEEIVKKAKFLTLQFNSNEGKLRAIFDFVRDSHTDTLFESKVASDILRIGGNSCHQRSILFAALCRAVNIPARLHWQKMIIKNFELKDGSETDLIFIHGIVGAKLNNKWFLYEPVGNDKKWHIWVQKEESNTIMFVPEKDCLYDNTDKITFETLPLHFEDYFEEMMIFRRKISSGEVLFD